MAYYNGDLLKQRFAKALNEFEGLNVPISEVAIKIGQVLRDTPTSDVKEVKRGKWKHLGGDEWLCTNCGEVITTEGSWEKPTKKYCNECGADMRGDKVLTEGSGCNR